MTPQAMATLHGLVFTMPRPWSADEFSDLLGSAYVFAIGDERGFLLGRAIAGEAEVLTLAVAPALRRQGLARALLAQFRAEALARQSETAFLEVAESNNAAIALYTAAGFRAKGRRKGYFTDLDGRPQDALVMVLPLDATASVG
jgi:ribosomal-protein-alanine N-acetyltransferase